MNKYQEALDEIDMQVNKAYIDSCYEKATKQSMRKVEDIVGVNIKILKELVDRATPLKVDMSKDNLECPYCQTGRIYFYEFDIQSKYCADCGQALDWNPKE